MYGNGAVIRLSPATVGVGLEGPGALTPGLSRLRGNLATASAERACPTRLLKLVVSRSRNCSPAVFSETPRHSTGGLMLYTVPVTDKLQLARFLSGIDGEGRRIAPSFRSVLFLLIDCSAARMWSSARIAAACGVSERTVGRAFAYWRACGVLDLRRRQRRIAEKSVSIDAALMVAREGVALAKNLCAVARNKARCLVRTFMAVNDHLLKKEAPWREPGAPTESLKRLLRAQDGRSLP